MVRSAVTVSLVAEARGGPFIFWDDLPDAVGRAAALGFDAVEIFPPEPEALSVAQVQQLCHQHQIAVAALGSGAGMVRHGLSLTDVDSSNRQRARDYIAGMIQLGAKLQAPVIVGSMQGRWTKDVSREQALDYLADALAELGQLSAELSMQLFYEPLNRYETNLVNHLADGCRLMQRIGLTNVRLLADLFHMNIEEASIDRAIVNAGDQIGHIHFVDSNRQAAGLGHIDFKPILAALKQIRYQGYLSAEAFPLPDSQSAAKAAMDALRELTA